MKEAASAAKVAMAANGAATAELEAAGMETGKMGKEDPVGRSTACASISCGGRSCNCRRSTPPAPAPRTTASPGHGTPAPPDSRSPHRRQLNVARSWVARRRSYHSSTPSRHTLPPPCSIERQPCVSPRHYTSLHNHPVQTCVCTHQQSSRVGEAGGGAMAVAGGR